MLGGLFFFFLISFYTFFLRLNNQGLWFERHGVPKRGGSLYLLSGCFGFDDRCGSVHGAGTVL